MVSNEAILKNNTISTVNNNKNNFIDNIKTKIGKLISGAQISAGVFTGLVQATPIDKLENNQIFNIGQDSSLCEENNKQFCEYKNNNKLELKPLILRSSEEQLETIIEQDAEEKIRKIKKEVNRKRIDTNSRSK